MDLMIDIETLATSYNAAIVSIGAVFFDPCDPSPIKHAFYGVIDIDESYTNIHDTYFFIDPATKAWWDKQPPEAKAVFDDPGALPISDALAGFADFLGKIPGDQLTRVWANSPSFDLVILEHAYNAFFSEDEHCFRTWPYYKERDLRTYKSVFTQGEIRAAQLRASGTTTTAHNALADAVAQAKLVCELMKLKPIH